LAGCASQAPKVVTEYEIIKLTKLVFVPIRTSMTKPVTVEYVPPGPADTYDLKFTLQACQTRTMECNGKLAEIAKVQGTIIAEPDKQE